MEHKRNGVMKIEERRNAVKRIGAAAAKYKFVLLMVAAGVILMLMPSFGSEKGQEGANPSATAETTYSLEQIQSSMENMLSEIDGVGQAKVMLTVSSGSQLVYQDDRDVSYSGSAAAPEDYTSQTETVLLDRGSGLQEALQTQEIYPQYIGALVVCDGAGSASTVLKVKEAVSVLTGLGTDCISVVKRSES